MYKDIYIYIYIYSIIIYAHNPVGIGIGMPMACHSTHPNQLLSHLISHRQGAIDSLPTDQVGWRSELQSEILAGRSGARRHFGKFKDLVPP